MKKVVFLCVFLLQIHKTTTASQPQSSTYKQNEMHVAPKDPPQVINIYNNLNQHGTNQQSQTSTNINNLHATISSYISSNFNYIITNIKTHGKKYKDSLMSYIIKNKKKVAISCVVFCYASLFLYCSLIGRFLSNPATWHTWKKEVLIEDFAQNNEQLFEELLLVIAQKYFNQYDPLNHVRPLVIFYNDITKEINTLTRFLKTTHFLSNFYIISILPISKKQLKKVKEKIKKLEALQKFFIVHMAKHNIKPISLNQELTRKLALNIINPLPPIIKTLPYFVPPRP